MVTNFGYYVKYISYFSHYCNQASDKKQLRKKLFIEVYELKGYTGWWERVAAWVEVAVLIVY